MGHCMDFVGGPVPREPAPKYERTEMKSFEEETREIKQMKAEDFIKYIDERRHDIHSFPGLVPPNGAVFLGFIKREEDIYAYYMDEAGEMYYENDAGHSFKKKMAKATLALELERRSKEKRLQRGSEPQG